MLFSVWRSLFTGDWIEQKAKLTNATLHRL
jgi:hypothetical protein